ncbi:MAG TPA: hypothetical protein VFS10_00035, partial [Pyrinomonadaceae bacterium]|nr:hypothetical protein [Pyrinomonadaceae bacterium]
MPESEFKIQVLETEPQWKSGLLRGLRLDGGGISLFANPSFESWLTLDEWRGATGDIVVDECGQIYWSAVESEDGRRVWSLFRHDPRTGHTERVLRFDGCGPLRPRKMWLRGDMLWLLDRGDNR